MLRRLGLRLAVVGLLAMGGIVASFSADAVRSVPLTILYTNDTHGHIRPFSFPETYDADSPLAQLAYRRDIGGAARRATLVSRIRQEKDRSVLLIDAGDICDGTPFSVEYHGDADMAVMNALRYDLACPGNHELNNPFEQLKKLILDARFPYLCANIRLKKDGKPLYAPYLIKEIGGVRVAFFGLLTYSARNYPAAREHLDMEPPIDAARRLVPRLQREADIIVAITHIGVEEDRQLAVSLPDIDIIIGGHSHTLLPQTLFVGRVPWGRRHSVNGIVIEQDFQWAATLGRLDVTLRRSEDGTWSVADQKSRLLPITAELPDDPAVSAVVDRFWKPIAGKYDAIIGQAAGDFTLKNPDFAEYNLVADAVRSEVRTEFDLENLGSVRAPLVKGPITLGDMVTLDPFSEDHVITFKMTGRQIKDVLTKDMPAVSGIRYVLNAGVLVESTIHGKPIEDDTTYRGSTNSWYAQQPSLREMTDKKDTGQMRREVVIRYIKARGTVSPAYDGRRMLRNMGDQVWHYNY